ncbi:FtsX-like permease family protein [Demequina sp. NBRC 110054]|uniref:FtsX-like permease family protein n=1 Tax=Demequina sp. NBRC 110054 TaxID=1570343 RepID=UPI0009FC36C8|nr:FtsX-like permease family protein [Demequina sp. NBRC 110054]
MRHLSWIAVGVVGALLGWALGPVWAESTGIYNAVLPGSYSLVFLAIYAPLLIALGAAVAGTLDAAHLATRRAELAALHALGQPRSSLIGREVRRSAVRASIAAGTSLVLGAAAVQLWLIALRGTALVPVDWWAVADLAVSWLLLVVSATLGTWWAAVWATRPGSSPADSPPGASASDEVGAKRRPRWPWFALAFSVATIGTMLIPGITDSTNGLVIALGIAASLSLYLLIPVLLVYWGSGLGNRIVRRLGRALGTRSAGGSARSLAADALVRPAPLRVAALGAVGLVVAIATGAGVLLNGMAARNDLAQAITPDAYVSTVNYYGDVYGQGDPWTGTGWAPALDEDLVASLEADERLIVVRAATLVTEETPLPESWGAEEGTMQSSETLIALAPDALDAISADGLRPTYLDDGVAIGGASLVALGDTVVELDTPSVSAPFLAIDRAWAEDTFGPSADSTLLLYVGATLPDGSAKPEQDSEVQQILADHDLEDAIVSVTSSATVMYGDGERVDLGNLTVFGGPFLLAAVGIVIALSAATQRLRAREHATLVALGVQAGTLRAAAAIEAGVVTAVGAALGLVAGTVLGAFLSALNGAGGLSIRAWNVGYDLAQAPWAALLALVLASTALAAGMAALVRFRAEARTPAEQLRDADKEGVR